MVSLAHRSKRKPPFTSSPADCPVCLICGGGLIDIRGQIHCVQCHAMWDSASDGQSMAVTSAEFQLQADEA